MWDYFIALPCGQYQKHCPSFYTQLLSKYCVYSLLAHISLLSAVVAALNRQCLWYICLHYVTPISLAYAHALMTRGRNEMRVDQMGVQWNPLNGLFLASSLQTYIDLLKRPRMRFAFAAALVMCSDQHSLCVIFTPRYVNESTHSSETPLRWYV